MTNTEHQKGVALLFALGILSLILVMGLAFLGNSLISQKIAFNSQESSVSRFLARSAVDRALAHLTLFNLIQARDHATFYAADASSVFSRISTGNLEIAGETQTEGTTLAAIGKDQLSGNDSKLNVEKKYDTPWYWGKNSAAKWIYVHQNGIETAGDTTTNTNNPIVARYAYQVLPQTSLSRISLYGVTSGANNIAGTTPAATNPRIPHFHRWGADVDELVIPGLNNMFLTYWGDENSQRVDGQYEFDNFINLLSSSNAPNPFYGKSRNIENRKRWLRNIFVEGKGRVAREAYTDGWNWYPRFNLGKRSSGTDAWYSRFLRSGEDDSNLAALRNSADVLDRLTAPAADSADCKFDDSKVRDSDYLTSTASNPIGLPFLRSIGDKGDGGATGAEIGGFAEIEHLRKQIAANLNDYCDEDSIPTSNIPAQKWSEIVKESDAAVLPAYTGNEKTHYINEIALGVQLTDAKFDNSGKFVGKVDAEVLAELIRIYDSVPDISKYKLHGYFKHLALTFSVTFKGSVKVDYTNNADSTPGSSTVNIDEELSKESAVKFDPALLKGFDISWNESDKVVENGSYWVSNWQSTDEQRSPLNIDFSEEIKKKVDLTGKTVTGISVDPSNVTVKLLKVEYNITNLALMINDAAATPANYGVDFVKFSAPSGVDGHEINIPEAKQELFSATGSAANKAIIHFGVMQAIDPRQNLNAVIKNSNNKTSDWYITAEPTISFVADKTQWDWKQLKTRVSAGDVNVCSNPKEPLDGSGNLIAGKDRDLETVIYPDWRSNVGGYISTAFIRNAPMRSPWELGFIHRGIPFQTINLKGADGIGGDAQLKDEDHEASNFAWTESRGTRYEYGDAGILDQIKMTEFNKSYGKVDMSSLRVAANPDWWITGGTETVDGIDTFNRQIFKSLFENMRTQEPWRFLIESAEFETAPAPPAPGAANPEWCGTKLSPNPVADDYTMNNIPAVKLRSQIFNNNEMKSLFISGDNDAAREERIGKTVNLIEAESNSLPNVFRIVVVAQTIRDLTGSVSRLDSNRNSQTGTAMTGRFDANIGSNLESSFYFDEILSESRMLVTVEKIHYMEGNTPRARLRVKQIEYLD